MGGLQAGTGHDPTRGPSTRTPGKNVDLTVDPKRNAEGEAELMVVQSMGRGEAAQERFTPVILQSSREAEAAIDRRSIPYGRREHVIRYFEAIRSLAAHGEKEK